MDNFNWNQFTKRVYINSNIEQVYNAWTKSEELEKWFLSNASFYAKNNIKINSNENVTSNSKYKWKWFAQNHSENGTIFKTNNKNLITFSFEGNCIVEVKLTQEKNQTLVELTQKEIPLDNNSKENIRLGCAFGWTFYLLNLKSILEGGIDLRNKDTKLIGVINN
jgi:uncharacterized protein YndB with AHSA1/START domain